MASFFPLLPRQRRRRARERAAALRVELPAAPDAARARALADALEDAGELLDAVETLTVANRLEPRSAIERRLVRLRRKAVRDLDRHRGHARPPERLDVTGERPAAVPLSLSPAELDAAALHRGILRDGCVLVRGLVRPGRVARLRDAIDRAFEARDLTLAGAATPETATWYDPVERVPKDASRTWVHAGQGVLAADSPRAFFEFLETVREIGLDRLIADYLGERPVLSVEKTTLRRADASLYRSAWHQDGAFLGTDIRTVDAWFALSRCGRDAPGLDVVPIRLTRVLPTAEPGTYFQWTVSPDTVARELPGTPVWRPEFEEGDVLLFDHLLLHRTAAEAGMPGLRYAIESWFFAPSAYPRRGITPLVV
jgi:hypothetical protein